MSSPIITSVASKKAIKLLETSAKIWFCIATIGQWIFGLYVIVFYHGSTLSGDFEKWNRVLPKGYIPGDWIGNLSVAIHVLLGGIIIVGGPLQFIPFIQKRFKQFHRWLGRSYVVAAIIIGVMGLVMVWTRGSVGDQFMHISISISAIYLILFAVLTIKNAISRQFKTHRKMALRLFMMANGGWFFRIGIMGWILINGKPVGFDIKTFSGPALWVISVLSYSLPAGLFILELYFLAQERKKKALVHFATGIIILAIILTVVGVFAATMMAWVPRIIR